MSNRVDMRVRVPERAPTDAMRPGSLCSHVTSSLALATLPRLQDHSRRDPLGPRPNSVGAYALFSRGARASKIYSNITVF